MCPTLKRTCSTEAPIQRDAGHFSRMDQIPFTPRMIFSQHERRDWKSRYRSLHMLFPVALTYCRGRGLVEKSEVLIETASGEDFQVVAHEWNDSCLNTCTAPRVLILQVYRRKKSSSTCFMAVVFSDVFHRCRDSADSRQHQYLQPVHQLPVPGKICR